MKLTWFSDLNFSKVHPIRQHQCIHTVFSSYSVLASWVIVDVMVVLWPNNTLFLPLAVAPLCVLALWVWAEMLHLTGWTSLWRKRKRKVGEREKGSMRQSLKKPFVKTSTASSCFLVRTAFSFIPLFLIFSTLVPCFKTAVATICCMFLITGLLLCFFDISQSHASGGWIWMEGRSLWLLNEKWGVFQERLQLRPEGFPADNPSHPHCQDLLTLEQEKDHLSCLVSPGRPRLR